VRATRRFRLRLKHPAEDRADVFEMIAEIEQSFDPGYGGARLFYCALVPEPALVLRE
jgi:hypothetical protein